MITDAAKQFLAEQKELDEAETAYSSLLEKANAATPSDRRKLASELSRAEVRLERARADSAEIKEVQVANLILPLLEAAAEGEKKKLAECLAPFLPLGRHADEQAYLTKLFLREPRQGRALDQVLGRWRNVSRSAGSAASAELIAEATPIIAGLVEGTPLLDLLGVPLPKTVFVCEEVKP